MTQRPVLFASIFSLAALCPPALFPGMWIVTAVRADAPPPAGDPPTAPTYWLAKAQAEAASLTDPTEKAGVLTAVAHQLADAGNPAAGRQAAEAALPAARNIADAGAQFRAYLNLASFYDQVNDPEGVRSALAAAQAAADAIPAGQPKDVATRQLAELRATSAGLAEARKPIDALPDPASRAQAYAALAARFAERGHRDEYAQAIQAASASADAAKDPMEAGMLKSAVARVQADAKDLDAAWATADTITDPTGQAAAYTGLAAAYTRQGQPGRAKEAIDKMVIAAGGVPDERKAAVWLDVARARRALGDTAGAQQAIDSAARAADRLEPADRAEAYAAASRLRSDMNDAPGAAILADDALNAAKSVTDPSDAAEVMMSVAAAQARAGSGEAARQSVAAAEAAGARVPRDRQHPGGEPPPPAYMDVIQAAAAAGDAPTAQAVAAKVNDPRIKHDAALAVAGSEVNLGQYQAAEAAAQQEGSADAEAAVCAMIASNLARTRTPADAAQWVEMLPNNSDKVAARLAVAEFLQSGPPATQPARP